MIIISLAAAIMKSNRRAQPRMEENLRDGVRVPHMMELTPEQRIIVSDGPQVKNEPRL